MENPGLALHALGNEGKQRIAAQLLISADLFALASSSVMVAVGVLLGRRSLGQAKAGGAKHGSHRDGDFFMHVVGY
jgi:hypothetical protein